MNKTVFIGAGNMASALIAGLIRSGTKATDILAIDPSEQQTTKVQSEFGVAVAAQATRAILDNASTLVLAVKPQQMPQVVRALSECLDKNTLIVSVAAGIRTESIAKWLANTATRIVRTMPNTPALVGAGITGMYATTNCSAKDRDQAQALMAAGGEVIWVEKESQLDAVTAISGSGPAYVFYFIEALQAAGLALGLSEEQSKKLAIATFTGASKLAAESSEPPAVLRERVTSKGGTTAAGLAVFAERQIALHIQEGAKAADARAKSLGDEFGAL